MKYRTTLLLLIICSITLLAQKPKPVDTDYDSLFFSGLQYRNIGPFRGGRSTAVCGIPGNDRTFYFGATGGGVWKTSNGGSTWHNISDGFFGGSIGSLEVSPSDPNVIYVGGGENTVRGNVSHGNGVWRSDDAGKTWKHMGLADSRHIMRILIHPQNPDIVLVAALGHLYGPNQERGIYRSVDGGKTWQRTLFINDQVGFSDLSMDPTNHRIMFAGSWRVKRTPYSLESGGEGSGLWKSTDGGISWKDITKAQGLPKGPIGIVGVSCSGAQAGRVWAIIEAPEGGLFRSDDGGEHWTKVNSDGDIRQRAWYYSKVYADPKDPELVYVLNVELLISKDGGRTFKDITTPHSDHHSLWIDPQEPQHLLVADDGGAQVSFDGGKIWSSYHNQPTAQFYRVTTDDHFPYRIYAAQQDNSTVRILHRKKGWGGIGEDEWDETAGGESGWIAPDPNDNDVVYGGSYMGYLTRYNHRTEEFRAINVWPEECMGYGAKDCKYRFQWNFPILFSKHDKKQLYAAANVLFKSNNEGQSWEAISPDLTRNDTSKMGPSGGPITKDNTSVEYYGTIFAVAESATQRGVIWVGTDDGLIQITRDGGMSWENITPPTKLLPEWSQINSIEADPFLPGGLYVAATAYKSDNFKPYLLRTKDFGQSWEKITKGIDESHFTRVIRADPERKGLLYAGTEQGMYISFDDGANWRPFQLNLPIVPITDICIKQKDLIVATQGRSLWILDDLSPVHQYSRNIEQQQVTLFNPRQAWRLQGGGWGDAERGKNLSGGPIIDFFIQDTTGISDKLYLDILDNKGQLIKRYSREGSFPELKKQRMLETFNFKAGLTRFNWNMRYPDAERFDGMIMWGGGTSGPLAVPGTYKAKLVFGKDSLETLFQLVKDPRLSASQADLQAQFDFLISVRDKLSETHKAIKQIRQVRTQLGEWQAKLDSKAHEAIITKIKDLSKQLTEIEQNLYQTQNRSAQDPLNFPVKLNNKLATVGSATAWGDFRPTDQSLEVKAQVSQAIDVELAKLSIILQNEIPAVNKLIYDAAVPAIKIE